MAIHHLYYVQSETEYSPLLQLGERVDAGLMHPAAMSQHKTPRLHVQIYSHQLTTSTELAQSSLSTNIAHSQCIYCL